ncbi:thiazole synthase [Acetobacteraceae bacterium]|nr:thiazole synthase [Acetobacteraceae bacterium]
MSDTKFSIYGEVFASRLFLGTARYPSPSCLKQAVQSSQTSMITVSLRREMIGKGQKPQRQNAGGFQEIIKDLNLPVLPNTAGCLSIAEAITTAQMSREIFGTNRLKLEIIHDENSLQPDVIALVEAARLLSQEGFKIYPYTTPDLSIAERLLRAGCEVLMPGAAPIGTGQGINDPSAMKRLRTTFPETILIADAGLRLPSEAAALMEWGYDGILANTAIARAGDPIQMAHAFSLGIQAGRNAYMANPTSIYEEAVASTPLENRGFHE